MTREDTNNGFKWTIAFTQNSGNLRMLQASPYRYEVQRLQTTGGSPTPLNGQIGLAFGGDSVVVSYDATEASLESALQSMPSVGDVQVSRTAQPRGQYTWLITFRALVGDVNLLTLDTAGLFGSEAAATVTEVVAGSNHTLVGKRPRLTVYEKMPGLPSYSGQYSVDEPGSYQTRVTQLMAGGLRAKYYNNQFLWGTPALERVDPQINFDWGNGLVTPEGSSFVSIRWEGKILPPVSETYTFYLTADDAANLALNHTLLINASDICCIEHRATVFLQKGTFYHLALEYQQLTGAASVNLQYSSASVRKQVIPAAQLYYATDIVGSPFATQVPHPPYSLLLLLFPRSYCPVVLVPFDHRGVGTFPISTVSVSNPSPSSIFPPLPLPTLRPLLPRPTPPHPTPPHPTPPLPSQVVPGAADYPYTDAFGPGLTNATAGQIATFHIQTKDAMGNNKTLDYEATDPNDLLSVALWEGSTYYYAQLTYLGEGLFRATYLPMKSGPYQLSVKMGGFDIQCARKGQPSRCSPFHPFVAPGPTVPSLSEAESPAEEKMDYLVEAVTGHYGYYYIQAKDAFGNNRNVGGDEFRVEMVQQGSGGRRYTGTVDDHGDGTYTARYTVPAAGTYSVGVTLVTGAGVVETISTCVAASAPFVFSRYYDGVTPYVTPSYCTTNAPTLLVVHSELDPPSCVYHEGAALALTKAVVGVPNSFTVTAHDQFGNIRRGDHTTHFAGYGDGMSDYFTAEFTQAETGDRVVVSSAIDYLVASNVLVTYATPMQYFRLSFGGRTTANIPGFVSSTGLEAVLEDLFDGQLDVVIDKVTVVESTGVYSYTWKIQFLTMLDVWQSMPDSGPATGSQLTLLPPVGTTQPTDLNFYTAMTVSRGPLVSARGVYPLSFTLWHTGAYLVRLTNNGVDLAGSPLTITVTNAPLDPATSFAAGAGLVGGVAGAQVAVTVQAMDTHQPDVQYVSSSAVVGTWSTGRLRPLFVSTADVAAYYIIALPTFLAFIHSPIPFTPLSLTPSLLSQPDLSPRSSRSPCPTHSTPARTALATI